MEWLTDYSDVAVVSLDWFGISTKLARPYSGEHLHVPDGWKVQVCAPTSVWQWRWFLLDKDGNKMATVLCSPRSPAIPELSCVVEIANQWLYMDNFPDIVDASMSCLPMVPTGLNRVDLACDFEMDRAKWQVFRWLEDGQCYLKGLRRGVVWWFSDRAQRVPHQLSWGGKESTFHWKIYYKYKELHEGGGLCSKPYIEELWRKCGMEPKKVWRCEVSIVGSNGLTDMETGTKVPMMKWWTHRAELFRRIYGDKFVVRMDEGHADKRNDPRVTFLNIEGIKLLRHKLRSETDRENDVERRIVCKLWKEFQDPEVRANDFAKAGVRDCLMYFCQRVRNVQVLARRFKLTEAEIMNAFEEAQ